MHSSALETQQPASHAAAGPVFILADDLTGACDSGVAFLAAGRNVRVVLDVASLDQSAVQPNEVLAITTETRTAPEAEAAAQVARSVTLLRARASDSLLFKKIDSAARGHLAAETLAALTASGAALALVAPAFPPTGRSVRSGVLTIRDAANQNATVALRDLFSNTDPAHIAILPASHTIEQGIAAAIACGIRILLCDAETQSDLEHLATAASRIPQPILWTGSAGLAHALAATFPHSAHSEPIAPTRNGRTLLFVGTDHPVTTLQVSHLEAHHAVHQVDWTTPSPQAIRTAFAAEPTAALVLTGGETAAFVLRALEATSIQLAGELAPGIPWGILSGGAANGCMVVTKSGGFGPANALIDAFDFCHKTCTRRTLAPA